MTNMNTSLLLLIFALRYVKCSDITNFAFASARDGLPAAFGDFNSDELTDVFVLRNDRKTVEVLLAADEEPFLRPSKLYCNFTHQINSVVPGDFDGDAFMDILVTTTEKNKHESSIHIIWGGLDHMNCTDERMPVFKVRGQPLAIDYNQDMIIDLFGLDVDGNRTFWVFNNTRRAPQKYHMNNFKNKAVRHPHSHAFVDLNQDFTADLFVTTEKEFEIWFGLEEGGFEYNNSISILDDFKHVGQSLFIDVELIGRMDLITPVCYDYNCKNSAIMVYVQNAWHNLQISFKDNDNVMWRFVKSDNEGFYTDAITLRSGDFNMDGYPDMLVTLIADSKQPQTFLLENVPCQVGCTHFSRTYAIKWKALNPFSNGTVMGAFYDFYQDGILDVIVVQENKTKSGAIKYSVGAFKNSLDYDANFVKVMVLTGLTNKRSPTVVGRLGKKKRTYGTNLPGPRISYHTTTQEGDERHGASVQLPQSAHNTLSLPFTIFGLGRTPNFVDSLTVGLSHRSRAWTQIIPNSQMVVIPWPAKQPSRWRAQLFVTPSKLILMSVAALTAVCGLITIIIGALYWRERQEDKKERLQESHRFHFDAM